MLLAFQLSPAGLRWYGLRRSSRHQPGAASLEGRERTIGWGPCSTTARQAFSQKEDVSVTESERARTWMLHQFFTTTVSSSGEKFDDVSPVQTTKGRRRRTRHLPFLSSL